MDCILHVTDFQDYRNTGGAHRTLALQSYYGDRTLSLYFKLDQRAGRETICLTNTSMRGAHPARIMFPQSLATVGSCHESPYLFHGRESASSRLPCPSDQSIPIQGYQAAPSPDIALERRKHKYAMLGQDRKLKSIPSLQEIGRLCNKAVLNMSVAVIKSALHCLDEGEPSATEH